MSVLLFFMVFFRKPDISRTIVYKSVRLNLPLGRRETASCSSMQINKTMSKDGIQRETKISNVNSITYKTMVCFCIVSVSLFPFCDQFSCVLRVQISQNTDLILISHLKKKQQNTHMFTSFFWIT